MPQQNIWFFASIVFSLIAWGIVAARYIWPELRHRQRAPKPYGHCLCCTASASSGWHS